MNSRARRVSAKYMSSTLTGKLLKLPNAVPGAHTATGEGCQRGPEGEPMSLQWEWGAGVHTTRHICYSLNLCPERRGLNMHLAGAQPAEYFCRYNHEKHAGTVLLEI